jgi:hypothetical protein
MGEPVGNSPRSSGDIPANSHKTRDTRVQPKDAEPPAPIEKIIEGKVVTEKTPWYRRYARTFIADDAQSIGDFLVLEILIPGFKNLLSDTIKGSTDRILYGGSRVNRRDGYARGGSIRTRYDRMASGDAPDSRRSLSRDERARHDFDRVVLDSHAEAVDVIEALIDRIARYRAASVSDLYSLVGVTGSFADRNYGWTDLTMAEVRQVRRGYLLDLPRPEVLR